MVRKFIKINHIIEISNSPIVLSVILAARIVYEGTPATLVMPIGYEGQGFHVIMN